MAGDGRLRPVRPDKMLRRCLLPQGAHWGERVRRAKCVRRNWEGEELRQKEHKKQEERVRYERLVWCPLLIDPFAITPL